MGRFIMLAGIPASGKSVYAKSLEDNYEIHSSDKLREELFGDINDQDHNAEVFQILHENIIDSLRKGKNVVYDVCNINSKRRISFLNQLRKIDCIKECHIVAVPYDMALYNNAHRSRSIPNEVITRMYKSWQTPGVWEGFDHIELIQNIPGAEFDISNYFNYNQNNPHHKYSLGEHMFRTAEYVKDKTDDYLLYEAALRHDSGKPFCEFKDENGISHYYGHESVGAWDVLTDWSLDDEDCLFVSQLIAYHMRPMRWDNEVIKKKYEKLWGTDFYNRIMLLHEADKEG